VRAFKIPQLEDKCEDYQQTAEYLGTLPFNKDSYELDQAHVFKTGEKVKVCSNTAFMLTESRFKEHFKVTPLGSHRGLFDCSS